MCHGDHLTKQGYIGGTFRKITVGALGPKTSAVLFLETDVSSRTDFVIVRC
jgi:hypothetical protein